MSKILCFLGFHNFGDWFKYIEKPVFKKGRLIGYDIDDSKEDVMRCCRVCGKKEFNTYLYTKQ